MKKYLLLILCLILSYTTSVAWMGPVMIGGSTSGASCSASTHAESTTDTNDIAVGNADDFYYVGQTITSAPPHTVCQIKFRCGAITGDISAKTFTAYMYNMAGGATITPGSPNCTSDTVSGATLSVDSWFTFAFSPACSFGDSSDNWAIVVSMDEADGSNYASVTYGSPDDDSGHSKYTRWVSAGTLAATNAGIDVNYMLYEME